MIYFFEFPLPFYCAIIHSNACKLLVLFFFPSSADLQNAIENENYAAAAQLRDQISKLEAESLAASAKALAFESAQYAFRLGQKVTHKKFGISTWLPLHQLMLYLFAVSLPT